MARLIRALVALAIFATATPLSAQDSLSEVVPRPWFFEFFAFVIGIPYTLYMVFVDGQRMHLLPAPIFGLWVFIWSFREWRRQRFWTPRLVPILAVLGLATIIAINVDWVMNGGEMWTQRYVVIAIFGLFPWIAYLVLGGPRLIGRRRLGIPTDPNAPEEMPGPYAPEQPNPTGGHGLPHPWAPRRVRMEGPWWVKAGAMVAVGCAAFLAFTGPKIQTAELRPDLAVLRTPDAVVPLAQGEVLGNPGAEITIFVFGDYACEACAYFAKKSRPLLDSLWVQTDEARIVFFDRPFRNRHPNAALAAQGAYCAGDQDGFWSYHDRLFETQDDWAPLGDPAPMFIAYSAALELDERAFASCLESGRHADRVAANEELADQLGIESTPTIVVGRRGGDPRRAPEYTYRAVERAIHEVTARGSS